MKKIVKNFKSDVVTPMQQKRLMKVNKLLSSKYVLGGVAASLAVILFLFFNYILNLFSNFKYIFTDLDNVQAYTGIKYAFIINPQNLIFYVAIIVVIIIAVAMLIYKIRTAYKDLNVGQKGDERWTTIEEIKEQYRAVPEKTIHFKGKGGVPVCWYNNEIYIDDSPVNTLVIGITRAGKGETYTYPTIDIYSRSSEQPSMIILDPKLDEYPTCYKALTERGYDVYLFNLNDLSRSMGYNPFQLAIDEYKAGRVSEAELILHNFCYSIFHTKATANAREPFWADGSTNILYCLSWAQIEDNLLKDKLENEKNSSIWKNKQKAFTELTEEKQQEVREKISKMKSPPEELQNRLLSFKYIPLEYTYIPTTENEKKCTMISVLRTFLSLLDIQVQRGKETISALDIYFEMRPIGDRAKMRFATTKRASPNQKGNLYQFMTQQVTQYLLDDVARFTAHNTLNFLDIGFGEKPVAVFLTIPDYDESLHTLATTFIDQAYFALSKQAGRTVEKRCKREVLFYLEEVGNIPEIKNLKAGITMGLSRGFKFILSIQAYSQLQEIYGEKGAETIIGNCGNQVYIKTDDKDTAKHFSELIGSETITNVSRMGQKLSLNKTFTETYEEHPLLNANQLMDLQEEECVIKRAMMRRDLKGNKIRTFPIYNCGETSFKMRYKYMADEFPSGIDVYSLPTGDNSTIDLEEHTLDLREFFADLQYENEVSTSQGGGAATKKEKNIVDIPIPVREQSINVDALRDSKALLAEVANGAVLLSMLQNMLGINRNDITVGEAIREIELAEKALMITSDYKESLFMLLEESEVNI